MPNNCLRLASASSSYSDKELFMLISQNDETAFGTLFHRHTERLLPFIYSIIPSEQEARDVIQNMFIQIWSRREMLSSVDNPVSWLNAVAYKTAYSHLRKEARYRLHIKNSAGKETEDLLHQLDARYTQALINEAVGQLPLRRRQIFILMRMEGLSRKEVAAQLNISENTVRNQLVEAVSAIQEYLQKHGAIYLPAIIIPLTRL